MSKNYKDLQVYKRSYEMAKQMYQVTKRLPKEELFGLTSQIKRAAVSIPLNIAEGYAKGDTNNELLRFLKMARGSTSEMQVLIDFIYDFGYIDVNEHQKYAKEYDEIGKMMTGLIKSITSN